MQYDFDYNVADALQKANEQHTAIPPYVDVMFDYLKADHVDRPTLRNQFARLLKKFYKKPYVNAAIDLFNAMALQYQDETLKRTWILDCPFDPENKDKKDADRFHIFGAILHSFPDGKFNGCFDQATTISLIDEVKKYYKIK